MQKVAEMLTTEVQAKMDDCLSEQALSSSWRRGRADDWKRIQVHSFLHLSDLRPRQQQSIEREIC